MPAPGVYGVPEQWPHVHAAYERAGFVHDGRSEIVYVAKVDDLSSPDESPLNALALRRTLGINGTRLSALAGDELAGYIEVATPEDVGSTRDTAEIGNLHVAETHRRRGFATWLIAGAADWLRLARVDRVLAYASAEEEPCIALLEGAGFRELARTRRGWARTAPS